MNASDTVEDVKEGSFEVSIVGVAVDSFNDSEVCASVSLVPGPGASKKTVESFFTASESFPVDRKVTTSSSSIELTIKNLSTLVNSYAKVEVYKATGGVSIARGLFDLGEVVINKDLHNVSHEVKLFPVKNETEEEENVASVANCTIEFAFNENMSKYIDSSRLLDIESCVVENIPETWLSEPAEKSEYTLSIPLATGEPLNGTSSLVKGSETLSWNTNNENMNYVVPLRGDTPRPRAMRAFLDSVSANAMRQELRKGEQMGVYIVKHKKGKSVRKAQKDGNGFALFDISELLTAGQKSYTVASRIGRPVDKLEDLYSSSSLSRASSSRTATDADGATSPTPDQDSGTKEEKNDDATEPNTSAAASSATATSGEKSRSPSPSSRSTSQQDINLFEESGASMLVSFRIAPSLVEKVQSRAPKVTLRTSDVVPRRVLPVPQLSILSENCMDRFRRDLVQVARDIAREHVKQTARSALIAQDEARPVVRKSREDMKSAMYSGLKNSGQYEFSKGRLRKAVLSVIREVFQASCVRGDQGKVPDSLPHFFSELSHFMNNEVKRAIKQLEEESVRDSVSVSEISLQQLAMEAEILKNYEKAESYFHERLAMVNCKSVQAWIDFGYFLLRRGQRDEAKTAFCEALDLEPDSPTVLLPLASIALEEEKYSRVIHLLQMAQFDSTNRDKEFLKNALMANAAEGLDEFENHDRVMDEAVKLSQENNGSAMLLCLAAREMVIFRLFGAASSLLSKVEDETERRGNDKGNDKVQDYKSLLSSVIQVERGESSIEELQDLIQTPSINQSPKWLADAKRWFADALELNNADDQDQLNALKEANQIARNEVQQGDIPVKISLQLRIGRLYQKMGKFIDARRTFADLKAPNGGSNYYVSVWLNFAVCCIELGDANAAEKALCEANKCSSENADVYGYLSLIYLGGVERKLESRGGSRSPSRRASSRRSTRSKASSTKNATDESNRSSSNRVAEGKRFLNQAFEHKIENYELLQKIADTLEKRGELEAAGKTREQAELLVR
eukprot:g5688.t1